MWSGSLLTNYSGSITGAHQRINRLAYKYVKSKDALNIFPTIKEIQHFEGKNGPDGIKAKSPAKDEPWHYFNPYDEKDRGIIKFIQSHYDSLVTSLRQKNHQKSAFEAAWLAHAIVDGLTPAHHYPYEEELEKLRGESKDTRISIKDKLIIPGNNKIDIIRKNWKMWGAKGLFTTHGTFELGIAMLLIVSEKKSRNFMTSTKEVKSLGLERYFRNKAVEIADLDLYKLYYRHGWTTSLSKKIRKVLIPIIITSVAEVWLAALEESEN